MKIETIKSTKRIYLQDTEYFVEYKYKQVKNLAISDIEITNVIDNLGYKYNLGILRTRGIESIFILKIEHDLITKK